MTFDFLTKPISAKELKKDLTPGLAEYEKSEPKMVAIDADYVPDAKITEAANAVVNNIGVLNYGNNVIRAHPSCMDMAVAVYHASKKAGSNPIMFLWPFEEALDALLKNATDESMKCATKAYVGTIKVANHWSVTYGRTGYELSAEAKKNYHYYGQMMKAAGETLNPKLENGELVSWNMIHQPLPNHAANVKMDFEKYETKILDAMCIKTEPVLQKETEQALASFAKQIDDHTLVGRDGLFQLEIGNTSLKFGVEGRQVFRDVGRAGVDVDMKTKKPKATTNNPFGEFFVAPVETSVNGSVGTQIPSETPMGTLSHTYFKFEDGYAIKLATSDNDIFKKVFSGINERAIAELGFGGQNPGLKFLEEIGLPTGDALIDEKVFPLHIAIGANDHMGGDRSAKIHHDFSIGESGSVGSRPLTVKKVAEEYC